MVLQVRGVVSEVKIHHLDPPVDRSIRIVWQLEQVLKPYHMMFKDMKGGKKQLPSQYFCKKKKSTKILKHCFLDADFRFLWGVSESNPSEKWGMNVLSLSEDSYFHFYQHTMYDSGEIKVIFSSVFSLEFPVTMQINIF